MTTTYRTIIRFWDTHRELAADIGAQHWQVAKWAQRDRIPPEWWTAVVDRARAKGKDITVDDLARLAAAKRPANAA